jgi:diguanylate cyclase
MTNQEQEETITVVAKKVLLMMSQQQIPLYPQNYSVWFDYVIGVSNELVANINRIIKEGGQFTEEVNSELYRKHFGKDARLILFEDLQKEIQKILKDILGEILNTQNFTSDYHDKLKDLSTQLETAGNVETIHLIVANLMQVTMEVMQSSHELKERLEKTTRESENLQMELERSQQEVLIDPLTMLYNRKAFDRKLCEYIKTFQEEGRMFSVVMIDIDHFKKFNDHHGHLVGDKILAFMGSLLTKELKGRDFIARYGGEEFVILMEDTSTDNACSVANNIRKSVEGMQLRYVESGEVLGKIAISAGVSSMRKGDTMESLVKRADDALYLAKYGGRNNVKSELDLPNHDENPAIVTPLMVEFLKR